MKGLVGHLHLSVCSSEIIYACVCVSSKHLFAPAYHALCRPDREEPGEELTLCLGGLRAGETQVSWPRPDVYQP